MGLVKNIIELHQEKVVERNNACEVLIGRIDSALSDFESIFNNSHSFVDPQVEIVWKKRNESVLLDSGASVIRKLRRANKYKILLEKQEKLMNIVNTMSQIILQYNENVAREKIPEAYMLIGNVEGKKLDTQQMACIVKEAHNHLVIAGAGTGKTTTIIGKIKYLIKTKKYLPKDILVLSFTNASAYEMKQRISKETEKDIDVSTFHKLGLNIISKVNGVMPKITKVNLREFIKENLISNMQSEKYLKLLSSYLLYNRVVGKSEFEFKSQVEYDEYLRLNPPVTINNENVKSYGEMDIANFLTQNGIQYIYEQPYEIDTRTSEYGQYYPDFYLPEYNIYIEYFGINRNGEVPSYFRKTNGMSATETYNASIEWKRSIHRKYKTVMIECYAYEKMEGKLLEFLRNKLEAEGITLIQKSSKELWSQIISEDSSLLDGIIELFETMINLIKSNGYDISEVRKLNKTGSNKEFNDILLFLFEPIFNSYCKYLNDNEEIDFNDMINLASEYVRQGKYVNPYKYVIVDEYQDISKARFTLLKCLRDTKNFELFCVGDDWQSIYRFAGSDIGYIVNFSKYWGPTEISRIETTYRFSQKLIEISSEFIMKNPEQIKKSIKGKCDNFVFPLGEIQGYTEKTAIDFVANKINDIPKNNNVFFIGRYALDVKMLDNSEFFSCSYDNVNGYIKISTKYRSDLDMKFLTAHKSKGLQADYVFIINNKKSRMGFPNKMQDAPILELLLDNCDNYPYAEERRLFYVAMTRAIKKVYIVTINGNESDFVIELKKQYGEEIKKEKYQCPLCGGQLVRHSGPYGDFLGCSNYRSMGCNYKRKIR